MERFSTLILDSDPVFEETLKKLNVVPGHEVLFAKNRKDIDEIINIEHKNILKIFINPQTVGFTSVPIIKDCHRVRPGTPLFLLSNEFKLNQSNIRELNELGLQGIITKPVSEEVISQVFIPDAEEFNFFRDKDEKKIGIQGELVSPEDLVAVPALFLLGQQTVTYDLYLRLSEKKFIWIFKKGDSADSKRVKSYIKKGV